MDLVYDWMASRNPLVHAFNLTCVAAISTGLAWAMFPSVDTDPAPFVEQIETVSSVHAVPVPSEEDRRREQASDRRKRKCELRRQDAEARYMREQTPNNWSAWARIDEECRRY